MKWASSISGEANLEGAMEECTSSILEEIGESSPDLAIVFVSPHFAAEYAQVPTLIRNKLRPKLLFGCSAGGVIGAGREIEQRPGLSLTVAQLPDVELTSFHLDGDDLPDLDAPPDAWEKCLGVSSQDQPSFILLVDPFSFPAQNFLLGLDYAFSGSVKIGGMASGGHRDHENILLIGDEIHRSGAIGIAMRGNIAVDTVVAQGCRPIGPVMSITKSQQNMLLELDDQPPFKVLQQLYSSSNERDQELMQHSLFLGIVMDDLNDDPKQGEYLVRNVIGMDSRTGTMAIGETLREGQRVQFHLRDAMTSAEDLATLLSRYSSERRVNPEEGALLFSCLGRGQHLYGRPDHDTDMFRKNVGSIPLGGFFCNGEIGPVSGTTYLHGYTSSFGIFRPSKSS